MRGSGVRILRDEFGCFSVKIRKCFDYLLLALVLLIAADRYYPIAWQLLPQEAGASIDRNAGLDIVRTARSQIGVTVKYAPAYEAIEYPNGDVPRARGVCTDVLIRALRDSRGIDLQPLIYKDMKWHRWAYPFKSIAQSVDPSIVHRRVLNMECYFRRHDWTIASNAVGDFLPGDIVTCRVSGTLPHVMIVSDRTDTNGVPLVIHNIGEGVKEEPYLLANKVAGHFRCR